MDGARIASREVVDLNALDDDARRDLGHALFKVHSRVFSGIDEREFYAYVLAPPARSNVAELYHDGSGALVGYCAVHLYDKTIAGRAVTTAWVQGGLLPGYRGQGSTFRFGVGQALREKLRHPFRPLWFLSCLVHTSSYHFMCKYFPRVYPSPGREMPEPMLRMVEEMTSDFGAPAVDPSDPLVRDDGWVTIEPDPEAAAARFGDLPDVAYYMRRNPGFVRGHGMLVLVPLGIYDIAAALLRRLSAILRRRRKR